MPLIQKDDYKPGWPFTNGHFASIFPTLFRKVPPPEYRRQRIDTPDGDFIDIDTINTSGDKVAILCHGLEGNSKSSYITGMGQTFASAGWDVAAMNYRGCSGEVNRTLRFYHSGATDDLNTVVNYIAKKKYEEIFIIGFSLGGNLVLKYLGEKKFKIPENISRAAAFSVPVDLRNSSDELAKRKNWIYTKRFLLKLHKKVTAKKELMPDKIDDFHFLGIRNLIDFDEYYTAPIHGFKDADDYYAKNSSIQWLNEISIPTLLVNARNDPFLGTACYPENIAMKSEFLQLLTPKFGGHVGFYQKGQLYWSEKIALAFSRQEKLIDL